MLASSTSLTFTSMYAIAKSAYEKNFFIFFFLNLFFVAFPSESSTLQSCSPMDASSLGQLLWEMRKCKFTSKSNGMNSAFCFNGTILVGGQGLSKENERPQFRWQGVHHLRLWLKNLPGPIVIDFPKIDFSMHVPFIMNVIRNSVQCVQ